MVKEEEEAASAAAVAEEQEEAEEIEEEEPEVADPRCHSGKARAYLCCEQGNRSNACEAR